MAKSLDHNLFASCCVALLCACGITKTRLPPHENPLVWTYTKPIADVRRCLDSDDLAADAWGNRVKRSLFEGKPEEVPGARYSVTLESEGYGSNALHSESYLRRSCPLGLYGEWRVEAIALGPDETRVEVMPVDLHVHNYDCVYIGHPWGCAIAVEPSTVEEYLLLTSLGECLGAGQMPPVVRPKGDVPDPGSCD